MQKGLSEGRVCIHQLGHQCKKCGYVTIPARFFNDAPNLDTDHVRTYEAALKAYSDETDRSYDPVTVTGTVTDNGALQVLTAKVCNGCDSPFEGHGKDCGKCRQKAYRKRTQEAK